MRNDAFVAHLLSRDGEGPGQSFLHILQWTAGGKTRKHYVNILKRDA